MKLSKEYLIKQHERDKKTIAKLRREIRYFVIRCDGDPMPEDLQEEFAAKWDYLC